MADDGLIEAGGVKYVGMAPGDECCEAEMTVKGRKLLNLWPTEDNEP